MFDNVSFTTCCLPYLNTAAHNWLQLDILLYLVFIHFNFIVNLIVQLTYCKIEFLPFKYINKHYYTMPFGRSLSFTKLLKFFFMSQNQFSKHNFLASFNSLPSTVPKSIYLWGIFLKPLEQRPKQSLTRHKVSITHTSIEKVSVNTLVCSLAFAS